MINNIKWMMAKNDVEKLMALYFKNREFCPQIIDRLFEFEEKDKLLEIAEKDAKFRTRIVEKALDVFDLNINDCINIFSWLNISQTHKHFRKYVVDKFKEPDIRSILLNENIDPIAKASIKTLWKDKKEELGLDNIDEDYLKLKLIVEDQKSDPDELKDKNIENLITGDKSFREKINHFMEIRDKLTPSQEYEMIKKALIDVFSVNTSRLLSLLSIISLSKLDYNQKMQLIKEIDISDLYFFENFQVITDCKLINFDLFQNFFSEATIQTWTNTFFKTNYMGELVFLISNFETFHWLSEEISKYHLSGHKSQSFINNSYFITNNYGYRLYNIFITDDMKQKIKASSIEMQHYIMSHLHDPKFPLKKYIRALLLIGGVFNYKFCHRIMNRKVVENPAETVKQIEQNYLKLKTQIHDPIKLKELIENELIEKSDLISQQSYDIVTREYFESLTKADFLPDEVRGELVTDIPNLNRFRYQTDVYGKKLLCKYIGLLGLKEHADLINSFMEEDDLGVKVHASLALINLNDESGWKKLRDYATSPDFFIREQVASSLQIISDNLDDDLIVSLANDVHSVVSRIAISKIVEMPVKKAVNILLKVVKKANYQVKSIIAETIGVLNSPEAIPVVVELLNHADSNLYFKVINALSMIQNPISINLLKAMNLKKIALLEIKRAEALVELGDFGGWKTLHSYLNVNMSFIINFAKKSLIKVTSSENLDELKRFMNDSDPLISSMATAKICLYYPDLGWKQVDNLLKKNDEDLTYHVTHILAYFDFQKVIPKLKQIFREASYDAKMIVGVICYQNGIDNYLRRIDKDVLSLSDEEHAKILKAANDYPIDKVIPILEKIGLLQNPDMLDMMVKVYSRLDSNLVFASIKRLWKKSDSDSRAVLARVFEYLNGPEILPFMKNELKRNTPLKLKAELAFAMISHGANMGWPILSDIVNNESMDYKIYAIEKLAQLKSVPALKVLENHMMTPDEKVQIEIIKAIGTMGLRESLQKLSKFMERNSQKVKLALAKALGELTFVEAEEMLNLLSSEKDDYVRVIVDISKEKQQSGRAIQEIKIRDIFSEILRNPNWRLTENWFLRHYEGMLNTYENVRYLDLLDFSNKMVMDEEDLEEKKATIEAKLSKELIGSTDLDAILVAKKSAQEEIGQMVTIQELIKSILLISDDSLSSKEWELLNQALNTKNPEIIKAILLTAAKSNSFQWIPIIEDILVNHFDAKYTDLITYSVANKMTGKIIPIYLRLLKYERVRYYLVQIFNYAILHPHVIGLIDLKKSKDIIKTIEVPKAFKETVRVMLNKLLESYLNNEKKSKK